MRFWSNDIAVEAAYSAGLAADHPQCGKRRARLVVVGTSYRHAPVELRERLHLEPEPACALALRVAAGGGEAVALSTCNRTEIYAADTDASAAAELARVELVRASGLAEHEVAPALYELADGDAVAHLLHVAAGLDSMVLGEAQILGQVRQAHEAAAAAGAVGPVLNRLFHHALRGGKRVRSETAVCSPCASVPAAAAELARRVFGELDGRRILIIGAGKASELAAVSLVAPGVEVVFVNRTLEKGAELARRFGGEAAGLERLEEELERADVVVGSTRSPRLALRAEQVAAALPARRGRPLLFIDLAVPRDFDPAIASLEGCYLFDIDDISDAVSHSAAEPREELARAEAILAAEAGRFLDWQQSLDVVPAITAMRRRAEEIRVAELARARSRLESLSPAERGVVETVTRQILNKLLHTPTVRLKQAAALPEAPAYAGALQYLFGAVEDGR